MSAFKCWSSMIARANTPHGYGHLRPPVCPPLASRQKALICAVSAAAIGRLHPFKFGRAVAAVPSISRTYCKGQRAVVGAVLAADSPMPRTSKGRSSARRTPRRRKPLVYSMRWRKLCWSSSITFSNARLFLPLLGGFPRRGLPLYRFPLYLHVLIPPPGRLRLAIRFETEEEGPACSTRF